MMHLQSQEIHTTSSARDTRPKPIPSKICTKIKKHYRQCRCQWFTTHQASWWTRSVQLLTGTQRLQVDQPTENSKTNTRWRTRVSRLNSQTWAALELSTRKACTTQCLQSQALTWRILKDKSLELRRCRSCSRSQAYSLQSLVRP